MMTWLSKIVTKYIIWDLDGTLYQNDILGKDIQNYFYRKLLKTIPDLTPKKFTELTAIHGSWSTLVSHYTNVDEFTILDEFDKQVVRSNYLKRDEKIVNLIEKKLSNYRHLILTNSGKKEAQKCLLKIGFNLKTFDIIFARDTINLLKPDPKIYPIITKYTNTAKFRHLFVGDSIAHDIIPPKKYGFQSLPIWEINRFFKTI